jgi:hypothetical protein
VIRHCPTSAALGQGCRRGCVGSTSGVPQIADDVSRRLTRQPWAGSGSRPQADCFAMIDTTPFPDAVNDLEIIGSSIRSRKPRKLPMNWHECCDAWLRLGRPAAEGIGDAEITVRGWSKRPGKTARSDNFRKPQLLGQRPRPGLPMLVRRAAKIIVAGAPRAGRGRSQPRQHHASRRVSAQRESYA